MKKEKEQEKEEQLNKNIDSIFQTSICEKDTQKPDDS